MQRRREYIELLKEHDPRIIAWGPFFFVGELTYFLLNLLSTVIGTVLVAVFATLVVP
jgi:hypothetical protein